MLQKSLHIIKHEKWWFYKEMYNKYAEVKKIKAEINPKH